MTQSVHGHWVLLGITSFGSDCDEMLGKKTKPRAQTFTSVRLYSADVDRFTGLLNPWLEF